MVPGMQIKLTLVLDQANEAVAIPLKVPEGVVQVKKDIGDGVIDHGWDWGFYQAVKGYQAVEGYL